VKISGRWLDRPSSGDGVIRQNGSESPWRLCRRGDYGRLLVTSAAALECPRASCVCINKGVSANNCPLFTGAAPTSALLSWDYVSFHNENRVKFLKYVRFRGLSPEDAEDIVNDTFLVLYRARERLLSSDNQAAFGFKVLRDALMDHYRRSDRSPATVPLVDDALQDAHQRAGASIDGLDSLIGVLDVRKAIDELPERQSDCMRLHALLDLDIDEVARYLDITPSAVRSHLHIARRKLGVRIGSLTGEEVTAG
jgi:RNA polymerase sigma factor (sigma-70 family)